MDWRLFYWTRWWRGELECSFKFPQGSTWILLCQSERFGITKSTLIPVEISMNIPQYRLLTGNFSRGNFEEHSSVLTRKNTHCEFYYCSLWNFPWTFLYADPCRVIKNCIRERFRKKMLKLRATSLSEDPYRVSVIHFLNIVLGRKPKSKTFWFEVLPRELVKSFPSSLSKEEQTEGKLNDQLGILVITVPLRVWYVCIVQEDSAKDRSEAHQRIPHGTEAKSQ